MKSLRLTLAVGAVLAATSAGAVDRVAALDMNDYGMGAYATIAQWMQDGSVRRTEARALPPPMDYGMGAFPTYADWLHAGVAKPAPMTN